MHAYRDNNAATFSLQKSGPVWVNDMDPVWIITVAPFGSYNTVQFIDHCLVQ